jgi:hypothetical protein
MAACNLKRVHNNPPCTFKGTPGKVTLQVNGTTGSIQFIQAQYNGVDIPGLPSNQISFTIVAGTTNLTVLYLFSDTQHGAGTLNEVCDANTLLIDVNVQENPVQYRICA